MSPAAPRRTSRSRSRSALFALTLAAAAAALALPAPARAQGEPKKYEVEADGTQLFRALLDRRGITPITRREANTLARYHDVIVIVLGPPRTTNIGDAVGVAYNAVNHGGAALIASDSDLDLGTSQPALGGVQTRAAIHGAEVECRDNSKVLAVTDPNNPAAPPEPYRNCPFVVPLTSAEVFEAPDPNSAIGGIFRGLSHVATNSPGYITTTGFTGEFRFPLARYPANTIATTGGRRLLLNKNAFFAIGGDGEVPNNPYHFLAMADHSVFINQMLLTPGTDNLKLAYRTIEFLQGPNQRKRCLFIENGRVVEEFDGLRKAFASQNPLPVPNLGAVQNKLADLANAIVDDLQSRDVPNNILMRTLGLPRIMWAILVVAAITAALYLFRRWIGSRKPTDLLPPPAVAGAPSGPPGVFDRRQRELLRRDNVYEPVRDLVREFFVSIGIHGDQGPRHPKLVISDVVRRPESLRQAVRDFWKLAYGPPQEVTVARWRELEPYFVRLREAHADGKWRLVMPGAPVAAPV